MTTNYQSFYHSTLTYQKPATWQDYLKYRDDSEPKETHYQLFFYLDQLIVNDVGREGINHAMVCNSMTVILALWCMQSSRQEFTSFGHCLIEKPEVAATAPDMVAYIGVEIPVSSEEEKYINLNRWRVPDLVVEVSDITLMIDLGDKKQLYAALKIPEYWVINVQTKQVLMFILHEDGNYLESDISQALIGLQADLLNQTLEQLSQRGTGQASRWFYQQIQKNIPQNTSEEIS
ncbi:MAG: Uma2 family endonuclease [Coleofasciculaceae cyanobacterium SM2_1_6]|nr:Uma2 family endonuclease [Coleofasciculaceae cyanobacterium SM2_1_6]